MYHCCLPIDRRQALMEGRDLPEKTWGTVLWVDISDFTPITQLFAQQWGEARGAEELRKALNIVFEALIQCVHRYHGAVVHFEGDAITCWFDHDMGHAALTAALAMQQAAKNLAPAPITGYSASWGLKMVLNTGFAERWLVGKVAEHQFDILTGAVVRFLHRVDKAVHQDEIWLGVTTAHHLRPTIVVAQWMMIGENAFAQLSRLHVLAAPRPWHTMVSSWHGEGITPCLLPPLRERVALGALLFQGELRETAILFISFDWLGEECPKAYFDDCVCWVQTCVSRVGGELMRITARGRGGYGYATFGAFNSHEDDLECALSAAAELKKVASLWQNQGEVRMGISHGRIYMGHYGATQRATWGAQGCQVNVAARLMSYAAPYQVLVLGDTALQSTCGHVWAGGQMIRLKGVQELVDVSVLVTLVPATPNDVKVAVLPMKAPLFTEIHQLPYYLQLLLKIASAWGKVFEVKWLSAVLPSFLGGDKLTMGLQRLQKMGILIPKNKHVYAFSCAHTADRLADTLLFEHKAQLKSCAEYVE